MTADIIHLQFGGREGTVADMRRECAAALDAAPSDVDDAPDPAEIRGMVEAEAADYVNGLLRDALAALHAKPHSLSARSAARRALDAAAQLDDMRGAS